MNLCLTQLGQNACRELFSPYSFPYGASDDGEWGILNNFIHIEDLQKKNNEDVWYDMNKPVWNFNLEGSGSQEEMEMG